jgi:DNA-binding NtrC family response regulator
VNPIERVLVADDEPLSRDFLCEFLREKGLDVRAAENGEEALRQIRETPFDLIVTDLRMPGADGMAVLAEARRLCPETPVVMITAYGGVESAVDAMREGSADFIQKPFSCDQIEFVIDRLSQRLRLERENAFLREDTAAESRNGGIVGESLVMRRLLDVACKAARSNATILVTGESGTGKELLARLIHEQSPRAQKPFIRLNCAALPESCSRASCSGTSAAPSPDAPASRSGRFELADGGTIFLDDIDDMPLATQVKLLRVLQEREVERLGGEETIDVDVRVVAATKVDLEDAVAEGEFREDLYYRLQVMPFEVPPLRQRREDIPLLSRYFMDKFAQENGSHVRALSPAALRALQTYPWPGNVRELRNLIHRVAVLDPAEVIEPPHLGLPSEARPAGGRWVDEVIGMRLEDISREVTLATLRHVNGNRTAAAGLLGVTDRTIRNKLRAWKEDGLDESALLAGAGRAS